VSDFTFEHIVDPAQAARELDRVLKHGGWLCARTPNRYGYIALANRFVPLPNLEPSTVSASILRSG
jgi:SAM-dependent methyltransferase